MENQQDSKENKSKAFAIKTLMSNKKFAHQISDMWRAPAGSTKNVEANSLLKSIFQSKNNFNTTQPDGEGSSFATPSFPYSQQPTQGFSSMYPDLNTAPKMIKTIIPKVDLDEVKSIIASNPANNEVGGRNRIPNGAQWDKAASEIEKKYGKISTGSDTDTLLKNAYTQPVIDWTNPSREWGAKQAERAVEAFGKLSRATTIDPIVKTPEQSQMTEDIINIASGLTSGTKGVIKGVGEGVPKLLKSLGKFAIGAPTAMVSMPAIGAYNLARPFLNYTRSGRRQLEKIDPMSVVRILYPETAKREEPALIRKEEEGEKRRLTDEEMKISREKEIEDRNQAISITVKEIIGNNPTDSEAALNEVKNLQIVTREGSVAGDLLRGAYPSSDLRVKIPDAERVTAMRDIDYPSAQEYTKSPEFHSSAMAEIEAMVKEGAGATTTFLWLMSNKDKLAEILGMSQEEVDILPSASLAKDLTDLRKSLEKSANLEERSRRIENMILQGDNVERDFESYIRGKDEYLGTIERMQSDFRTKMAYADTSNPYTAQRMENYDNYLTILQGRQNQRYIDFLNNGVRQYERQIEQLTSIYNTDLKKVEEMYADQAALTTETYGNIKIMVSELYANIDSREAKMMDREKFEWERTAAAYKTAALLSDLEKPQPRGGILSEKLKQSDVELLLGRIATRDIETKEWALDDYNPFSVLNIAEKLGIVNPEGVFEVWLSSVGSTLKGKIDSGDYGELNKVTNIIRDLTPERIMGMTEGEYNSLSMDEIIEKIRTYSDVDQDIIQANITSLEFRNAIVEKVSGILYGSLIRRLRSSPDVLLDAIDSMTKVSWGGFGSVISRGNFISGYAEDFGTELAGKIFDAVDLEVRMVQEAEAQDPMVEERTKKEYVAQLFTRDGFQMTQDEIVDKIAELIATHTLMAPGS